MSKLMYILNNIMLVYAYLSFPEVFVYTCMHHLVSGLYRKVGDNLGKPQGLATQLNLRGSGQTRQNKGVEVVLDRVVF